MRYLLVFIGFIIFQNIGLGQNLEKEWQLISTKDSIGNYISNTTSEISFLNFKEGSFHYVHEKENGENASGDYLFQNNLLVLFFNQTNDSIRQYRVTELTDSTLVISEKNVSYLFTSQNKNPIANVEVAKKETATSNIIPSQGFSFKTLWRGILGMISLIVIAFLFSSHMFAQPNLKFEPNKIEFGGE